MKRFYILEIAVLVLIAGVAVFLSSCSQNPVGDPQANSLQSIVLADRTPDVPAYYDSVLHQINLRLFPPGADSALLHHNPNLNTIYMFDDTLPGGVAFINVIDAIQGDGFNPLWREVDIVFNAGVTPRQFFSDNQVLAATVGPDAIITLDTTNEVYRCAVVGRK